MRRLLLFLSLVLGTFAFAQMDTEHWFPAMFNNSGQIPSAYLYLSTNQPTPFTVSVYSGGNVYATASIAKGSPAEIAIPADLVFCEATNEILAPVSKGIYVTGGQIFFANLRFSVTNHAEFVTSKGTAGLGKLFYAAPTPLAFTAEDFDFTTSVIATEDNTTVTVSGYKSGVTFFDGTTPTSLTVKLNRGESYVMSGNGDITANRDGFIGAKITADKAVAMINGNMNGNVSGGNSNNRDIYMDESVPADRLGTDFIIIKGNGRIGDNMERPLIVATENGTSVYLNGSAAPYTFTDTFGNTKSTLNEGEYGLISDADYINQGGLYNMSVKSSKRIYVYQNLGGTSTGATFATGGYNFIPALSCFLPNKIDEIANINKIGTDNFATKINIITEKGGTITYTGNGTLSGPYPVTGNSAWETYNVLNASGNISITSTKSLTAGIAAGSGAVGYGGYFAGFNSVPVISKGGDCATGVSLQVDNSYDSYQWYLNGSAIASATAYSYTPTVSGNYTVVINKNDCGTATTPVYAFIKCPLKTTASYDSGTCNPLVIKPKFTNSTQNILPFKTVISSAPANGTATVDPATGFITYSPTNTSAVSDTFSYTIIGDDPEFPDSEVITVNVKIIPLAVYDGVSQACVNGTGLFYINNVKVTDAAAAAVRYFTSEVAAQTADASQEIKNFPYRSAAGAVYALVTDAYGCTKIAKITLQDVQPAINLANYSAANCDDDLDGSVSVVFSQITPLIISNYKTSTVEYSLFNDFRTLLPDSWSYAAPTEVYVRAYSANGCVTVKDVLHFSIGKKVDAADAAETVCDDDTDGVKTVDIGGYKSALTGDAAATIIFFNNEKDADLNANPITNTQVSINQSATFFARLTDPNLCPAVVRLTVNINVPKTSAILKDTKICAGSTATLDAGTGFDGILWSTGQTGQTIQVPAGKYYADLTYRGCTYRQYVAVEAYAQPEISSVTVAGKTATVNAAGGNPPYRYSLDGTTYQDSNIFENLSRGIHTAYVLDAANCSPVQKQFLILELLNVITPNGDGKNDRLDYSDLSIKKDVSLQVYDRYGKMVFSSQNSAGFVWDGTSDGRAVPTGTYWYILGWTEPDTGAAATYKGWILVKNR